MELADLVAALDSPLCSTLAPELFALKPKVVQVLTEVVQESSEGCKPCQAARIAERKRTAKAMLHIELMNVINAHPDIANLMPNLITTGRQAHDRNL